MDDDDRTERRRHVGLLVALIVLLVALVGVPLVLAANADHGPGCQGTVVDDRNCVR